MSDDLDRFRDNCFQFSCDKLDPQEQAWMMQMLAQHPALQAEVDAERELVRRMRDGMAQYVPELVSFDDIEQALVAQARQREATAPPAVLPRHPLAASGQGSDKPGWWRRMMMTPASNRSRWAVAALVMLGVMLSFPLRHLVERDNGPDEGYRAVNPSGQQPPVTLSVKFRDDVTLGVLADKLAAIHLRIRSGPSVDGRYEVVVVEGAPQEAIEKLRAASLASDIQILEARSRD